MGGFMKFILFFYLLSLSVITGAVLSEDYITESDFYRQYLENSSIKASHQPIQYEELPSEVIKSFSESAFGDKMISQVYIIPASDASKLFNDVVMNETAPEKMYLLTLATETEQDETGTILKFNSQGKLVNVQN